MNNAANRICLVAKGRVGRENLAGCDLLLKGGRVIDGQRAPRFVGDVAITQGRIAAIGSTGASEAHRVVDARELVVAPGFIDLHTDFDSQIFWSP